MNHQACIKLQCKASSIKQQESSRCQKASIVKPSSHPALKQWWANAKAESSGILKEGWQTKLRTETHSVFRLEVGARPGAQDLCRVIRLKQGKPHFCQTSIKDTLFQPWPIRRKFRRSANSLHGAPSELCDYCVFDVALADVARSYRVGRSCFCL